MEEIEVIFDLSEQTPIEAEFEVLEPPSLEADFLIAFTPSRVSELENDAHYINETQLNQSITDVRAEFNNEIEYVRDDVSDLNKALIENVTTLDNKIDTVNQELTSDIDTLTTDVAKDINALSSEVASKYNTLSGLISTETDNRVQADNNLKTQINTKQPLGDYATNTRVNAVASDVALNKNQIEVAFQTMEDDKSELKSDVEGLAADIDTLDGKIEVNTTNITSLNNIKADKTDLNITNNNLDALTGDVENLSAEIDTKQPIISDLSTIRSNAQAGKTASDTISTYGNIVTHNANEFQPTGNYALKSEIPTNNNQLINGAGYITSSALTGYATENFVTSQGYITSSYHDSTKQDVIQDLSTIRVNAQIGAGLSTQVGDNTSNIAYLDEKVREIELFKFPNAVIIGEPNISNGQVSGFSTSNYMQFPFILDLHDQAFQIDFCFTTATNVTTQQNILDSNFGLALAIQNGKGVMAISSNGTSWNIGSAIGTITIQPNTTYYARLTWNKLQYKTALSTDGVNYTEDMVLVGAVRPYPRTIFIGGCDNVETGHTPHPFLGSINMNKALMTVMGQVIWQGMDDAGLSTRADLSLSNLDAIGLSKFDNGNAAYNTIQSYGDIVTHNASEFQLKGDYATNTRVNEVENKIPSLTGYATENYVQNYHDNTKQNTITDLTTIRDGASKGATALQSVPSEYITETELSAYHDSSKQDVISDLSTIRANANLGATALQVETDPIYTADKPKIALKSEIPDVSKLAIDTSVVHKANAETITGVKTFTGGTGGNSVGIISENGMSIGSTTKTAYTQYATIRNCDNKVNTGSYYINSDGSVLFRHKTGTATAEGNANDVMFTLHPVNGIKAGWSGTAGVGVTNTYDVLIDTIQYSKLNTNNKDVLGAINEIKSSIPSLTGYATESYVQGYHDATKQDVISDLEAIRTGASKGSTAIQQVKTINGESIVGSGDITIESGNNDFIAEYDVTTWQEVDEAYNSGKNCYCYYDNCRLRLSSYGLSSTGNVYAFVSSTATIIKEIRIYPNNRWLTQYREVVNPSFVVFSDSSEVANDRFDGQWVSTNWKPLLEAVKSTSIQTIDLSSVLPSDNYQYEVLINTNMYSTSSTATNLLVWTDFLGTTNIATIRVISNSRAGDNTSSFILSNNKKIYFKTDNTSSNGINAYLLAYRRLGTNE